MNVDLSDFINKIERLAKCGSFILVQKTHVKEKK